MSPRTDLCGTCHHLRNDLQFKARKEKETQDLLKRYKEHLAKAKLERDCDNAGGQNKNNTTNSNVMVVLD
jgi:hypothetical protein